MVLEWAGLPSECGYGGNRHNANGLSLTGYGDIGPTVVRVADNGHHEETSEGQQSLFSWAGEPAQPQGRNGKPKPSSLSLFEWALSTEQERELSGAGR